MSSVFIDSHNIVSPLGFSTHENFEAILAGESGVELLTKDSLSVNPFYGAFINSEKLDTEIQLIDNSDGFTRFEKILLLSMSKALKDSSVDITSERTLILISTTKGNIELLDPDKAKGFLVNRVQLWTSAKQIQIFFGNPNMPVVLSNACISGALAIIMASEYIKSGKYDNVVVVGADVLSKFVVSGFQSFMALAEGPCQPYDKNRNGLNLGEGCGTLILTNNSDVSLDGNRVAISGGASSNDSNHISGPSRTGAGLAMAIEKSMKNASISPAEVDYISAHGTATIFNDEMESLAFESSGLSDTPVNSFKGYYGHTLGAAGTIESILTIKSMIEGQLVKTAGYEEYGVSGKMNVIAENRKVNLRNTMKTASGFGGCNVAVIFSMT